MKTILLIAGLSVAGALGGAVAGQMLRPPPPPASPDTAGGTAAQPAAVPPPAASATAPPQPAGEFVKLSRQFIVPLARDGYVRGHVIAEFHLEMAPGSTQKVFEIEPRLRDAFLTRLYGLAGEGAFDGDLARNGALERMRDGLTEDARTMLGDSVRRVLVADLMLQDF